MPELGVALEAILNTRHDPWWQVRTLKVFADGQKRHLLPQRDSASRGGAGDMIGAAASLRVRGADVTEVGPSSPGLHQAGGREFDAGMWFGGARR